MPEGLSLEVRKSAKGTQISALSPHKTSSDRHARGDVPRTEGEDAVVRYAYRENDEEREVEDKFTRGAHRRGWWWAYGERAVYVWARRSQALERAH